MLIPTTLKVELLSDTTVGRGEGTAGAVDIEVEHDELGLPCLHGKTLHGLLRDSWLTMAQHFSPAMNAAAVRVFGCSGDTNETAILSIGNAQVAQDCREWIHYAVKRSGNPIHPSLILESFTDIRHQTSESRVTGAPETTTFRQTRVVLRELKLIASLQWLDETYSEACKCLAASVLATRHIGLARNRGRGHVRMSLNGDLAYTQGLAKGELQ